MRLFDDVIPLAPINRVARRVTGKGVSWVPRSIPSATAREGEAHSNLAPPENCEPLPTNRPDWTGQRRGRMVAFCFHKRTKAREDSWVVMCDCGAFETRRINKWIRRQEEIDCCRQCDDRQFATKGQYLSTGRRVFEKKLEFCNIQQ